jgi:catalase
LSLLDYHFSVHSELTGLRPPALCDRSASYARGEYSHESAPKQNCAYAEPAWDLGHVKADRYDHHQGNDEYRQAGDLYRLLKPDAQKRLVENIVGSLSGVHQDIQMRQLCHFFRADPQYGIEIAAGLGIKLDPTMMLALGLK